jgi:hypothetical protein
MMLLHKQKKYDLKLKIHIIYDGTSLLKSHAEWILQTIQGYPLIQIHS